MSHLKYTQPIRSWLINSGVSHSTAKKAAQKITTKLDRRERLEGAELQLVSAFLDRPNASSATDSQLAATVGRQAKGPRHTPEWTNLGTGDPGHTLGKGVSVLGMGVKPATKTRDYLPQRNQVPQRDQSNLEFIKRAARRIGG